MKENIKIKFFYNIQFLSAKNKSKFRSVKKLNFISLCLLHENSNDYSSCFSIPELISNELNGKSHDVTKTDDRMNSCCFLF